jgi:hypothetical protein
LPLSATAAVALKQKILSSSIGPFDAAFERLVNETLKLWHVPGVSIAVIDGDDTWVEVRFIISRFILV